MNDERSGNGPDGVPALLAVNDSIPEQQKAGIIENKRGSLECKSVLLLRNSRKTERAPRHQSLASSRLVWRRGDRALCALN